MTDSSTQPGAEETGLPLLKLDEEPLGRLLDSSHSSLATAIRRVATEAADRKANFAAFGNAP